MSNSSKTKGTYSQIQVFVDLPISHGHLRPHPRKIHPHTEGPEYDEGEVPPRKVRNMPSCAMRKAERFTSRNERISKNIESESVLPAMPRHIHPEEEVPRRRRGLFRLLIPARAPHGNPLIITDILRFSAQVERHKLHPQGLRVQDIQAEGVQVRRTEVNNRGVVLF